MEQVNKKRRADRAAELDARLNAMDDLEDDDERRELASSVADKLAGLESASVLAGMPGKSWISMLAMNFRMPKCCIKKRKICNLIFDRFLRLL